MTSLLDGTKIKYVPTAHTYPLVIKKNQTMVDNNLSKKERERVVEAAANYTQTINRVDVAHTHAPRFSRF